MDTASPGGPCGRRRPGTLRAALGPDFLRRPRRAACRLASIALLAGACAPVPCWAQAARAEAPAPHASSLASFTLHSISAPDYWLHLDTGLAVARGTLEGPWRGTVRWARGGEDPAELGEPSVTLGRGLGGSAFVELPSSQLLTFDPQHPTRPQISLGSSSESLRSVLREAGLNASTCVAPLMRMHSTIAGDGPRTNVSISARCSFR